MNLSKSRLYFCAVLLLCGRADKLFAQSPVQIGFNSAGLSSLRYQGTEFLSYGDLRLSEVSFVGADGSTSKGNTNSTVSVDAGQQTQTRNYTWGSVALAYAVSGNRLNVVATVRNQTSST